MANPGQPTISLGATGDVVKRLQRALWRTPSVSIDGVFGPQVEAAVRLFQEGLLRVDGIVRPETWAALPDGGPMPTLQIGSTGAIVSSSQTVLTNGASEWNTAPHRIDGNFGPDTMAAVIAFQA
jgi:peptidoglycan hydrolase-like protein with peptidoglycan-binding domain